MIITLKPGGALIGKFGKLTIGDFVSGFLKLSLVLAAILFFFMLIIGGLQWILSGGEKTRTDAAKNRIVASFVGLIIVFSAWAIAGLIGVFFGIDIFNLKVPTV